MSTYNTIDIFFNVDVGTIQSDTQNYHKYTRFYFFIFGFSCVYIVN